MEDITELIPHSPQNHTGDEVCGDSLEQHISDDKKATVDGDYSLNQPQKDSVKSNKKVIKHALRQQAKRRRKNTTIAAGGGTINVPILRSASSPHCELEEMTSDTSNYRQPTMAEVLSSIPGFHLRVPSRKRSNKKLSAAAQIEQTREGCVDLESPDSILVNTNLRQLLNRHTFASLPQLYQYKLLQLLPHVDRVPTQTDTMYRLSSSALNNEFFARACLDWRERLSEGEFTPENQAKLKAEQEKEKSKLDPWKLKHFEPMWGESLREWPSLPPGTLSAGNAVASTPVATTTPPGNKKEPSKMINTSAKTIKDKPAQPPLPVRTVGAVTRAVTSYREKKAAQESTTKVVDTSASIAKELKDPKTVEMCPDSTSSSLILHKENNRDKAVEMKVETHEPAESPFYEEKVEIIVENEDTPLIIVSDCDSMKEEGTYTCDFIEPKAELSTTCEGVQTDDSLILECEVTTDLSVNILAPSESVSPGSRKRRTPDVDDALDDLSNHDLPEAKRSRSEEREEPVELLDVASLNTDIVEETPSMEIESVPSELSQLEVPTLEDDCVSVTTIEADSNVETVDAGTETPQLNEVTEGMTELSGSTDVDLKVVEPQISRKGLPCADSNLENVELVPPAAVELPIPAMELQEGLEVPVESTRDSLCQASEHSEQDDDVDKTLVDLVDLQEEVADRQSSQSVKAEALNKSAVHLEEWEIIKVDPNDVTSEVACSTAGDITIPASVASVAGLPSYGNVLYHEDEELKEDEAALLAAAWDVVGSSSEFQHQVNMNQPVSVIPCQEELEVRLQESPHPAPQWDYAPSEIKCQSQGHVKLELEVTLTPEVDSSTVTSTCGGANGTKLQLISGQLGTSNMGPTSGQVQLNDSESKASETTSSPGGQTSYGDLSPKTSCSSPSSTGQINSLRPQQQLQVVVCSEGPGVTVIPPTTIVCLPAPSASHTSSPHPPPPPHHHRTATGTSSMTQGPPPIAQSSPALPFIALTTSTPVRALVTKPITKSSGRSGRNNNISNKPPPGAVNLERSYQICQAVIQNSPNRHQLRCQLKPPPALLAKSGSANATNRTPNMANRTGRVGIVQQHGNAAPPNSRSHVVFRHVFASSAGGIPVSMAVLPSVHHQVSEVMRGLELRRSNSAPPHSAEAGRGVRPPSAPPLPPPFASSASNTNNGGSSCSCSLKAMIACVMCGAFCHDDCFASPTSRLCVMCCDTR